MFMAWESWRNFFFFSKSHRVSRSTFCWSTLLVAFAPRYQTKRDGSSYVIFYFIFFLFHSLLQDMSFSSVSHLINYHIRARIPIISQGRCVCQRACVWHHVNFSLFFSMILTFLHITPHLHTNFFQWYLPFRTFHTLAAASRWASPSCASSLLVPLTIWILEFLVLVLVFFFAFFVFLFFVLALPIAFHFPFSHLFLFPFRHFRSSLVPLRQKEKLFTFKHHSFSFLFCYVLLCLYFLF